MAPVSPSVMFAGTTRYQVVARIGQGGMGTVFHVFDRERREDVALKTLLKLSPTTLQMFKQEFRALADVAHPNLVSLYEMSVSEGVWFFTMELVRGQNFLEHAWGTSGMSEPATLLSEDEPSRFDDSLRASAMRVLSIEALRDATVQLVRGLCALHAAGKLHLDVKPANVLVSLDQRVVLLDFGLVTEITEARAPGARLGGGTWAYMAPERLSRSTVTPASDFYSVGIMLYEALTGRTPFSMRDIDAGLASGRSALVPPRVLVPGVPEWLSELCTAMLNFDPAARPSGERILERLGEPPRRGELVPLPLGDEEEIFAGRDRPLAALADAFTQVTNGPTNGRPVSVRLHGPSGIGKTTLVRHFLRGLRLRGQAIVLEGRCYDRESVPFKALDTIVDRLTDHLTALPAEVTESLRPPDWQYLTELFPVLRRIRAFAAAAPPPGGDAPERRRRAFAALKLLLAHLGAQRPLVFLIDDFQWGDVDSAVALGDVLAAPQAPALLLLTCDRGEDAAVALHELVRRGTTPTGGLLERELAVAPLDGAAAAHISRLLLRRFGQQEELGDAIAEEAEGNPYLLRELAQNPVVDPGPTGAQRASLDRVLAARVAQLPDAARALLEIVVLSGRPLEQRAAEEAAQLLPQDRASVAVLRAAHLLTVRAFEGAVQVAAYHDRIRQAVSQSLTAERRREGHRALADVLEQRKDTDPETLHEHFLAAGVRDRAGHYALEAARQAARSLAFDRAATLYRRTIDLLDGYPRPWELEAGLAEALANAGKGEESGDAYLRAANALAAAEPGHAEVLTWKRRSFEEYLRAGQLEKGNAQMYAMAAAAGLRLPRSRRQKMAGLLLERAKLAARKMSIPGIPAAAVTNRHPLLLDVCWGAAVPISMIDPLLSNLLYTRQLRLALAQGDRHRVVRGVATEITNLASLGGERRLARARRLTELVAEAVDTSNDPYSVSMVHCARALLAHMSADFDASLPYHTSWEQALRTVPGASFELGTALTFSVLALGYLGRLNALAERLPPVLREIDDRGNLLHGTNLRLISTVLALRADRPDEALAGADAAIGAWPGQGFHLQHYFHLIAAVQAHLYRGDAQEAWTQVTTAWPRLRSSLFLSVRAIADEMHLLRARAAVALAATDTSKNGTMADTLLASAAADARKIARSGLRWSAGLSATIQGAVLAARGQQARAAEVLTGAATALDDAAMKVAAASARMAALSLTDPINGAAAAASQPLRQEGIANPARFAEMLVPGISARSA